jgi:hypothetical protein
VTYPNRVEFPPKLAGVTDLYTFNFLSALAGGETISTQIVTCSVYSGVDASPSSMISGAATASGAIVTQKITGGVAGVIYSLLCTITTSLGRTLQLSAYLTIPTQSVP